MKKKSIIVLCLFIIFCVCGCGKNGITGKYKQTNYDNGYLTLYENGSCYWKQITQGSILSIGDDSATTTIEYDSDNCTYDYNDDEITINTKIVSKSMGTTKNSHNCKFTNGTIDCKTYGTYSK